ncbi:MAG TPA: hypothetical protein VKZ63_13070 [Kofleriaceae bacterium]|nr:hypothetical protein [Kofleriaceae bacterium]
MWCSTRTRWRLARLCVIAAGVALGACSFDSSGAGGSGDGGPRPDGSGGGDDGGGPDGGGDVTCQPDQTVCVGRVLETCNATGDGFVEAERVVCPLTCEANARCTEASNIPADDQRTCGEGAPALTPVAGATVVLSDPGGGARITCSDCGEGPLVIEAAGVVEQGEVDLAWFCLSEVDIPDGVTVTASGSLPAIAFLVDGPANLAGGISLPGGDATETAAGAGGPGGFAGGALATGDGEDEEPGNPGGGPCGGAGGARAGDDGNHAAGGGGGGGHRGSGGEGGDGVSPNGNDTAGGGGAGPGGCGQDTLEPLVGGSGGASGADGSCGPCGWPGGGGGGAIQISSRVMVAVSGPISAQGGTGYGVASGNDGRGGGGGGGGGGAILLEAPTVAVSGRLRVDGGAGGAAGGGPGAPGAAGPSQNGATAADGNNNAEGGPGGGGGGGRVRLNGVTPPACPGPAGISPSASCTTGAL